VKRMLPATRTILLEFKSVRVVAAIFLRGIRPLLAITTL
jgi:hypothetical protein